MRNPMKKGALAWPAGIFAMFLLVGCLGIACCHGCRHPDWSHYRQVTLENLGQADYGELLHYEEKQGAVLVSLADKVGDGHIYLLKHPGKTVPETLTILKRKLEIRIDNTTATGSCRITVTNGSAAAHRLRLLTSPEKILLEAHVPSCANREPNAWRSFQADLGGHSLTVVIDGKPEEVMVNPGTQELLIDVAAPSIRQSPQRLQWR